ncbi:hypothetical protein L0657_19790 [Dyadobacter sp. CY345]|uniref:hypothetical protein n=1 Tax=Dyadobacter sp. CY345 TaxID=2909335 RepID=UPI001F22D84E|nr:hypothetical protein [Dyadobacter sp. CY345]MCF2446209.1 hypothetical protein [Dyadobacter sp. CY345]
MKTFLADIIPKIQKFSKQLDDLTILTNHHWVSMGEIAVSKTVYIFRTGGILLVSENGIVSKGAWEYLGNDSILIESGNRTLLLKQAFVDDQIMALKLDGAEGFLFFINETKTGIELNTIHDVFQFLEKKYIASQSVQTNASVGVNKIPNYTESTPKESYELFFGKHYKIQVRFEDGIFGDIFMGFTSKRYFYIHFTWGKTYCEDKKDCIYRLYANRKFNY